MAGSFLHNELGVSLHPEKTRIVHVDHGFEFLGYKVKRGKGLRLSASKRTSHANPHNLYAMPREKSVARFKDQIRNLTQRRAPVAAGHDRGDKPDHPRLGELLPESECPKAVP